MVVPETAAIALGSNRGPRGVHLARARERVAARLGTVVAASRIYETEPLGPAGQRAYLNQVLVLRTDCRPREMLRRAMQIENLLGRKRTLRWGPRTIDIDLLLHGTCVWDDGDLTLPHPRMAQRAFVLVPLDEILPAWRHPLLGMTVREMCRACDVRGVRLWTGSGAVPGGWLPGE